MAEAFATIGIVASILQLVDFGSRVLKRLNDYQSKLGEIPEAFRHIKAELPVLLDALRRTQAAIDAGSVQDESKQALLPAIEGCGKQIKLLDDLIAKALPTTDDSWVRKSRKAVRSLLYDGKVEKITIVIRGYIQTLTYHAATSSTFRPLPDRTVPRLVPSSTVPFRRDPHFVDREILDELDLKSQQPACRAALVGLGGVGKSQLAVEYAYRIRDKSSNTWVFWVHAGSTARLEEGYRKIAERAKITGWDRQDVDMLILVYNWLCDEANGRWLMIIDNADDLSVFSSPSDKPKSDKAQVLKNVVPNLLNLLPQSPNGSILITSRSRDVAHRLTGSSADIIQVDPMDQAHALALLQKKLEGISDQDDAEALVQALDYMPLAISQVAAYINQRSPRITLSSYLQSLRKGDRDRGRLLATDLGDSRRDGTASNSIIVTWQISFEHIRSARPSATRLLSLMSLFDRQGIPESLLQGRYQEDNDGDSDFEDDLDMLLGFSLVSIDKYGHQFEMHRLVQFSTRKWLELNGELECWKENYVRLMDDSYPASRFENWTICQALFPHAQAAVACRPSDESALQAWASVLYGAAWHADNMGNYYAAEKMNLDALEARQAILGTEHRDTMRSMASLASVYEHLGQWRKAEELQAKGLAICLKVLGVEHPDTLDGISNMGLIFQHQGRYKEAEELQAKILAIYSKVLGTEHPDTLHIMSILASIFGDQKRYKEAEEVGVQVVDRMKSVLGVEHPATLVSVNDLAVTFSEKGQLQEAEELGLQVLKMSEKVLGSEHPQTLICMSNLAWTLKRQNRDEEAITMMKECVRLMKRIIGPENPDTVLSLEVLNEWTDERHKVSDSASDSLSVQSKASGRMEASDGQTDAVGDTGRSD